MWSPRKGPWASPWLSSKPASLPVLWLKGVQTLRATETEQVKRVSGTQPGSSRDRTRVSLLRKPVLPHELRGPLSTVFNRVWEVTEKRPRFLFHRLPSALRSTCGRSRGRSVPTHHAPGCSVCLRSTSLRLTESVLHRTQPGKCHIGGTYGFGSPQGPCLLTP